MGLDSQELVEVRVSWSGHREILEKNICSIKYGPVDHWYMTIGMHQRTILLILLVHTQILRGPICNLKI